MKRLWYLVSAITASIALTTLLVIGARAFTPPSLEPVENSMWQQVNMDGFGNPQNVQLPSLAVFQDSLYAGTWSYDGIDYAYEVWRTENGTEWELAGEGLRGGAAVMKGFGDHLYLGTWEGVVMRTPDGLTWTDVITDGFGEANNGIARFADFDAMLYASTWSDTGTDIWRTADGVNWSQFAADGLGDGNNYGAIASEVFAGRLVFGTGNSTTAGQIWHTDGITWTAVITDAFNGPENRAVSSLASFDGYLYAGLVNEAGPEVWRSEDGLAWSPIITDGLDHITGDPFSALEVAGDQLYLVVGSYNGTGVPVEVWSTSDGLAWQQIGSAGFGDPANSGTYWDNATAVFHGTLYTGIQNWQTGIELWRLLPHQTYMPLILQPE
ncbi:MAG: hypothetical protein AB1791_19435 [Chloroflexota bacterium]